MKIRCDLCQKEVPGKQVNQTAFAIICNECLARMQSATGQQTQPKVVMPQVSLN